MRQILAAPLRDYLADLHRPVNPLIDEIRAEGIAAGLPLVEPETGRLLRSLVHALKARAVLKEVGAQSIDAIGITNQRETTLVWDRATGKPLANAIVWQDRRTAKQCDQLSP